MSSRISNGYVRTALPDGSFAPETYAFKDGGYLSGRVADYTIDKVTFASVAQTIAGPLAKRNYIRSANPTSAKLLIVVYWGTSRSPAETNGALPDVDQGLELFGDKMVNEEDAIMLGYDSASDPDLANYRYFVVLLAYDFQAFLKDKTERLLWQTRFSMNEHRNRFDRQLEAMTLDASVFFGRDSNGLQHDPVPEGRVEIGNVTSIGTVPDPSGKAVLAPDGAHAAYLTAGKGGPELAIADIDDQTLHTAGSIGGESGNPAQLAWLDAGRIAIKLPSAEILAFDAQGKRIELEAGEIASLSGGLPHVAPVIASMARVQAAAAEKLPDRTVVIMGSDVRANRFLLEASDGSGACRLFVYDRPTDLLFEIVRNTPRK